jgi:hypothetical protein
MATAAQRPCHWNRPGTDRLRQGSFDLHDRSKLLTGNVEFRVPERAPHFARRLRAVPGRVQWRLSAPRRIGAAGAATTCLRSRRCERRRSRQSDDMAPGSRSARASGADGNFCLGRTRRGRASAGGDRDRTATKLFVPRTHRSARSRLGAMACSLGKGDRRLGGWPAPNAVLPHSP